MAERKIPSGGPRDQSTPTGGVMPGSRPPQSIDLETYTCPQCRLTKAHILISGVALDLAEQHRELADALGDVAVRLSRVILRVPSLGGVE